MNGLTLAEIEAQVADRGLTARHRMRRAAAARHNRADLYGLVDYRLGYKALLCPASPEITWQVLRSLCRQLRFNRTSDFGSAVRYNRLELVAAGEASLLFQQWAWRREKRMAQGVVGEIGKALGEK